MGERVTLKTLIRVKHWCRDPRKPNLVWVCGWDGQINAPWSGGFVTLFRADQIIADIANELSPRGFKALYGPQEAEASSAQYRVDGRWQTRHGGRVILTLDRPVPTGIPLCLISAGAGLCERLRLFEPDPNFFAVHVVVCRNGIQMAFDQDIELIGNGELFFHADLLTGQCIDIRWTEPN